MSQTRQKKEPKIHTFTTTKQSQKTIFKALQYAFVLGLSCCTKECFSLTSLRSGTLYPFDLHSLFRIWLGYIYIYGLYLSIYLSIDRSINLIPYGEPQGSVLALLLFSVYMYPLGVIIYIYICYIHFRYIYLLKLLKQLIISTNSWH